MIRNFIFSLFFFTGNIFISIIFIPSLLLPKKIVIFGGRLMGYWTSFCLRFFLSTSIMIKGKENIINDKKFFIACSHQSMFETFFLQTIFRCLYDLLTWRTLSTYYYYLRLSFRHIQKKYHS